MNAHAFDSPQTLLQKEALLTATQMQQAVERYYPSGDDEPADAAAPTLDAVVSGAAQLRGAFVMLGDDVAAALAHELEQLAAELPTAADDDASGRDALLHAVLQLPRYLQWLQRPNDPQNFALDALIEQLRVARGVDASSEGRRRRKPDRLRQLAHGLRPLLQRGLLDTLRGRDDGVDALLGVLATLRDRAGDENDYRVWWLGGALLERVRDGRTALDASGKRLLRELDQNLKIISERGRLSDDLSEQVSQQLAERLPEDYDPARLADRDDYAPPNDGAAPAAVAAAALPAPLLVESATLTQLAEQLAGPLTIAQDTLSRLAEDGGRLAAGGAALCQTADALHDAESVMRLINLDVAADLLLYHGGELRGEAATRSPETALCAAVDLALIRESLHDVVHFYFYQSLAAPVSEGLDNGGKRALLIELDLRRAYEAVAKQSLELLEQARRALLGGTADTPDWAELPPLLRQLGGVLEMLENAPAGEQLRRIESLSIKFLNDDAATSAQGLRRFSELLILLERYCGQLGDSRYGDQRLLDTIAARIDQLDQPDQPDQVTTLSSDAAADAAPAADAGDADGAVSYGFDFAEAPTEIVDFDSSSLADDIERLTQLDAVDDSAVSDDATGLHDWEVPEDAAPLAEPTPLDADVAPSPPPAPEPTVLELPPSDAAFDLSLQIGDEPAAAGDWDDGIEFPDLNVDHPILPESSVSESTQAETVLLSLGGAGRTPTPPQAGPDQDQELMEIFYEEALGEVENIGQSLPTWRANMFDEESMLSLRRSFHTLKGSGRMVGETVIGEFGWGYEQMLNKIRDGQAKPTAAMADAIEQGLIWLDKVVYAGSVSGFEDEAERLVAAAEAVTAGRTPPPAIDVSVALPDAADADDDADTIEPLERIEFEAADDVAEPAAPQPAAPQPAAPQPAAPKPSTVDFGQLAAFSSDAGRSGTAEPYQASAAPDGAGDFMAALPPGSDPELIEAFIYEAGDILDAAEFTLQRWGSDPDNQALVNDLRREMHTLKGGSRLCGLIIIGDLAHASEAVMEAVPKGELSASPDTLDLLQRALDGLSNMINRVRDGVPLKPADDLINELYGLLGANDDATVKTRMAEELQASDDDFRETFLQEASEHLDGGRDALGRWRSDRQDQASLTEVRRALHTIKGSSRLVGIVTMGDLSQGLLELADACKDDRLAADDNVLNLIEQGFVQLAELHAQIQSGQQPESPAALVGKIDALLAPLAKTAAVKPAAAPAKKKTGQGESIRVDSALLTNLINQMGESSIYRARVEQGVSGFRFNLDEMDQTLTRLRQSMRRLEMETEAQILFRYEETSKEENDDFDPLELDRFAELQQLSRSLMEVVDDLANIHSTLEDGTQNMGFLLDQQGKVNKDIQQGLMRTGMVEFSTVVPRLRRVVRQAAQELGKRAQLVVQGDDAEIDRTILDNMIAPLEHMLRNALSHGIETPEQRAAAGKPEGGTITMSLDREGSELVLKLVDDGAGINYDRIRDKGEEKGLLEPGAQPSEQELIALLLQPGFSTAAEVTQIAGRGVGMDVLNEAIKEMRGALQIQSQPGQGSMFTIRLPFSLAVTQALLVKAGSDTYAVPMLSLEAVDRLSELEISSYLAGDAVKHYYGEREYPLHSMSLMFGHDPTELEDSDSKPAVLLFRTAEASAALQVDDIIGHQEVIVKPVGPQLHNVPGISGATVLGDGRVVVVLELAALVRKLANTSQQQMAEQVLQNARQVKGPEKTKAMVIDDSITMRKVTARFLGRHDIEVKVAKDGVEAVALLEEYVPDFMILDIEMPRMDGFEVVAHVRNRPRLRHLPIIMVTSRSGDKHRNRAAKLGVDDYLIKPYQEDELMSSIKQVLKNRGLQLLH